MKEFNPRNQDSFEKCKLKAFEQLMAYSYMEGADRSKYGSLLAGLQTQYLLGNNQYPQTITDANKVLSNHKFDYAGKGKHSTMKNESINENTVEENPELSFSQLDGKCYCCGKSGHKSPNCQWKSKPKNEWAINKLRNQQHQQSNVSNSGSNGQQSNLNTNGTN
jgi:hypothetical protein